MADKKQIGPLAGKYDPRSSLSSSDAVWAAVASVTSFFGLKAPATKDLVQLVRDRRLALQKGPSFVRPLSSQKTS